MVEIRRGNADNGAFRRSVTCRSIEDGRASLAGGSACSIGIARAEPGLDFIQEIQVQSVGASAEYGNLQGAVINVISKQGGHRFLADVATYWQMRHYRAGWLRADHDWKFGAQVERGGHNITSVTPTGERFSDGNSQPSERISKAPSNIGGQVITAAAFVSDALTWGGRITLNAGVRFEYNRAISRPCASASETAGFNRPMTRRKTSTRDPAAKSIRNGRAAPRPGKAPPMTDRWTEVEPILDAALARAPSERAAFIVQACAGDDGLRREVEALLAQESAADGLLSAPGFVLEAESSEPQAVIGRAIGPYTIQALLGAGGMGEVYRAHDWQLDRDVAIKILPPAFVNNSERLVRFAREAKTLAALNHPHIAAIDGLEDVEGVPALVLELVEGRTLAEHRSPMTQGSRDGREAAWRTLHAGFRGGPGPSACGER